MSQEISINDLKPHPNNELIYGQESVTDLVDQIKERGQIVVPLIINSEHVILSGHRRWGAAKELGLEVVPCEIRDFESPEDELEFLLHSNVTRKKSKEQLAREGIALEKVLSVQASKRRNENLKQFQSVMDESSTTDDVNDNMDSLMEDDDANKTAMKLTRDAVANALKIGSGKQFDKMKAVIKKVDELKELGKTEYAELFLIALNRSASAAYDLISVPLDSLTDDDKDNIRAGKVAPRQFLPEQTSSKHKKDSPYKKVTDEISSIQKSTRVMEKLLIDAEYGNKRDRIRDSLLKTIEGLKALLSIIEIEAEKADDDA